jgi:hypothetical protein
MRIVAMLSPLIAAGWPDFLRLLPFVIAFLVWVIGRFAGQLPQKPPQRGAIPPKRPPPQPPKKAGDPLQTEIDEFLRQAQAAREGRPAQKSGQPSPIAAQARETATPSSGRPGDAQRKRLPRRTLASQSEIGSRREESRSISRPPLRPVATEESRAKLEPLAPRESVAQHVAESLDSSKFSKRATQLGQVQESTDSEFRQHMQRVFQHELGSLKKEATGIFEAAGAAASAASADVSAKATAAAAGAQSGTAPVATHKRTSDIALFLAGSKNIRDAVILSEILQRPEHRW